MDPISGTIGMIAAIPQCIEAAKQLYDLRERFDQASILITAIYTESMVVAASLSQVQRLLHGTTLQNKPELRETLDRALTGCWVVYQCLDEEVRDLARKVDVNDLRKRDRARFLLKEANFKELLQQIRGQQSALGLLIQGLQMESLSEIKRLVGDNSVRLDQIAKRSKTLRQKHPNIKVPESVLDKDSMDEAQSLFGDAEFTFDDGVVNSKAYRRAMAQAFNGEKAEEQQGNNELAKGELNDQMVVHIKQDDDQQIVNETVGDMKNLILQIDDAIESHGNESPPPYESEEETAHTDMLDDLEKSLLPFMPPAPLSRKPSIVITETDSTDDASKRHPSLTTTETMATTFVTSLTDDPKKTQEPKDEEVEVEEVERPPPLPPRRQASSFLTLEKSKSPHDLKKMSSWEEIFSPLSTTSSLSLTDPSLGDSALQYEAKITRKSSPLLVESSSNLFGREKSAAVTPTEENDLGNIWASLILEEEKYIERLTKFHTAFYEGIVKEWPILEKHMEAVALVARFIPHHQEYILNTLKEQIAKSPSDRCDPRLFITWASKTYKLLKEYAQRCPHALYALRLTRGRDKRFSPFVETLGLSLVYFGKSWEDYLTLPIAQLDMYITRLQNMLRLTQESTKPPPIKDESRLRAALEVLQRLSAQCSDLIKQSTNQEELQSLYRRIHTADAGIVDMLTLFNSERHLVSQGPLAIKLNGKGPWQSVQAILLNNYFLWGKVKTSKARKHQEQKRDSIVVVEQPVPVSHLTARMPVDLGVTQKTSFLDELPRGTSLYEIFIDVIKDKSNYTTHTLGVLSYDQRNHWYNNLNAVISAEPTGVSI
ncbi:hypothetical protein N0V90_001686 [Kalmusia sp. IMI 367209]|nr:hypothetical protein N0V90_001686 [Kalmusia sp. IMI 367209]